jgi:hypothetical protein
VLNIAVAGRPTLSAGHTITSLSICNIDLTYDGKLGYGFTSADELEEIDIGPGGSHDQHLSAKSYAHVYES